METGSERQTEQKRGKLSRYCVSGKIDTNNDHRLIITKREEIQDIKNNWLDKLDRECVYDMAYQ